MNDYFAGKLAGERQADYLREVARDELVAQARRTKLDAHPSVAARSRWHRLFEQLAGSRLLAGSHRP